MTDDRHEPVLDLAARAWDAYVRGNQRDAERLAVSAKCAAAVAARRDRQRVEVVRLAIAGDCVRAHGLASEHLVEFEHDDLVRAVKANCEPRPSC